QAAVPTGSPPALRVSRGHDPAAEVDAQVRAVRPESIAVRGIPHASRVQSNRETLVAPVEADPDPRVLARRVVERADHARVLRDRDAAVRRDLSGALLALGPRLDAPIGIERPTVELRDFDGLELLVDGFPRYRPRRDRGAQDTRVG